jgi:UDP-GlcNAc:undecaprenyl-phosphate GlcNAc-1-phosphate transferase
VMLGVALRNEYLTLVLGISGCLVFLLVVTSRRDELANLRDDLQDRLTRGRQERQVAKLAWEAIQRVELCSTPQAAFEVVDDTARSLGCAWLDISESDDQSRSRAGETSLREAARLSRLVSGSATIFRLSGGPGRWITVGLDLPADSSLAGDIVFRYLYRLCQALAERLDWLGSSAIPPDRARIDSTRELAPSPWPSRLPGTAVDSPS